jgi:hypothetical protein
MNLPEFWSFHGTTLELDEPRHGLILNALRHARDDDQSGLSLWTLGAPGECAIRLHPYSIVLGQLTATQCRNLAHETVEIDYPGVIGPDRTAQWFADRASELGKPFHVPELQLIQAITDWPRYPSARGRARITTEDDAELVADWLTAFHKEAVPRDRIPPRDELENAAIEGRFLLWITDRNEPVSMAGITRRLRTTAAITGVYTPPPLRGRGYAGSATAATVERIYSEGFKTACLYTD